MIVSTIFLSLLLTFFSCVQSEVVLTQPEAETGRPAGSLRLTCKTSGFNLGSNYMHWVRQVPGKGLEWLLYYYRSSDNSYAPAIMGRFTASKEISSNIFALNMKDLKIEDTAIYYCARAVGSWIHTAIRINTKTFQPVLFETKTPSPPTLYGLVSSCQDHNTGSLIFGCLAMDYYPDVIKITWKKGGELITTGFKTYRSVRNKNGTYTQSSQLTLPKSAVDCPSKIYCDVQHSGSHKSKEMLCPGRDVLPPTLLLTVSSSEEIASSKFATLVCSIIDFHPKSISVSWLKNGRPLDSGFFTSPVCEASGNFSVTSRLMVRYSEWFNCAVYTCQVTHGENTQSKNITALQGDTVRHDYTVKILPPPVEQVLLEATVTLNCVVSNLPSGVNVTWIKEKKPLKSEIAEQPGQNPDSVISKLDISTEAWLSGVTFECVVYHQNLPTPLRDSIHKKKVINALEPSVSVLLPPTEEISAKRFLSLICLVRGFFPQEIFVKWTNNDKLVNPSNYKNTEVMVESNNTSFFMYSLLSITAEEWASGASYSCVVGHEAIPLKIINRTVDKSSDSMNHTWIEDYEDDSGNIWTTASTFTTLFFLSIFYSAAVTLVKVK